MSINETCVTKLSILSNETRLHVVRELMQGSATVSDLLKRIPIEQNLMSHHLRILREGGLVKTKRIGKNICYSLIESVRGTSDEEVDLGCCKLSF